MLHPVGPRSINGSSVLMARGSMAIRCSSKTLLRVEYSPNCRSMHLSSRVSPDGRPRPKIWGMDVHSIGVVDGREAGDSSAGTAVIQIAITPSTITAICLRMLYPVCALAEAYATGHELRPMLRPLGIDLRWPARCLVALRIRSFGVRVACRFLFSFDVLAKHLGCGVGPHVTL